MANQANAKLSVNEQVRALAKKAETLLLQSLSYEEAKESNVLRLLVLIEQDLEWLDEVDENGKPYWVIR
jgi:hypothetical protein